MRVAPNDLRRAARGRGREGASDGWVCVASRGSARFPRGALWVQLCTRHRTAECCDGPRVPPSIAGVLGAVGGHRSHLGKDHSSYLFSNVRLSWIIINVFPSFITIVFLSSYISVIFSVASDLSRP